ncbi:hypothetical protein ACFXP3_19800, partial [Streptomyces sp. NPDC059096]|uniref:hypothetical protein n=1 Tax=Streptomyces sp. NPDC059096 TaxID=3346727 RepID=UPI0036CA00A1
MRGNRDVREKGRRRGTPYAGSLVCGLAVVLAAGLVPLSAAPATARPSSAPAASVAPAGDMAPAGTTSAGSSSATDEGQDSAESAAEATTDGALAEAKRSGKPVEIASHRGEHSDVFATPEGTLEAREYLRPVRARGGGGGRAPPPPPPPTPTPHPPPPPPSTTTAPT